MFRNQQSKNRLKTLERKFQACLNGNDEENARQASSDFISALDRAAKSSIIHPNKAARKKSACAKRLASTGKSSLNEKPVDSSDGEIQEETASEGAAES